MGQLKLQDMGQSGWGMKKKFFFFFVFFFFLNFFIFIFFLNILFLSSTPYLGSPSKKL